MAEALVPTRVECVLVMLLLVQFVMMYLQQTFCHALEFFRPLLLGTAYLQALPIRLSSDHPLLATNNSTQVQAFTGGGGRFALQ